MIKEIEGDLLSLALQGKFDVIGHDCNCFCTQGAGIALQIKTTFPEVYQADLKTQKGDVFKLGEFSKYYYKNIKLTVYNLYTQYESGSNGEYTAVALALRNMAESLKGDEEIGLPLIGCGIAGLKYELVKKIIQQELADFDVTLIKHLEPKIDRRLDYDVHLINPNFISPNTIELREKLFSPKDKTIQYIRETKLF